MHTKTPGKINLQRRHLLAAAGVTLIAAPFEIAGLANAQGSKPILRSGTNTSFNMLKQIHAGVLDVGYAEAGPVDGPAVLLLHGWPYDIHSFVRRRAAPGCQPGYRVIVPYVRGYGTTRFLSSDDIPQWPALRARGRYRRLDGCAQNRKADPRRL